MPDDMQPHSQQPTESAGDGEVLPEELRAVHQALLALGTASSAGLQLAGRRLASYALALGEPLESQDVPSGHPAEHADGASYHDASLDKSLQEGVHFSMLAARPDPPRSAATASDADPRIADDRAASDPYQYTRKGFRVRRPDSQSRLTRRPQTEEGSNPPTVGPLSRPTPPRPAWQGLLATMVAVLLVAVFARVLVGFTSTEQPTGSSQPTATPTAAVTGVFRGPVTTPTVPTGPLAPPPTDCPPSPPLDSITAQPEGFSAPVRLYGRAPVWVVQGYLPQGVVSVDAAGTPGGYPAAQFIWEVGPTTVPHVQVQALDLRMGGFPGWWSWSPNAPLPEALGFGFIPQAVSAGPGFSRAMRSLLIVTHATCYKLDVTWQGGEWSAILAVGGRMSS